MSIVEALARQFDAIVQKSGGPKGTTVSIVASTGAGGSRGQRHGPLDQRSTKQLKSDLAESELTPRKKSFVQEILRRRREAKAGGRSRTYVWLGAVITAFGLAGAALIRLGSRAIGKK